MSDLPERQPDESPGAFLKRILDRLGTNPHKLSADLGGTVSATTIRSYLADENAILPVRSHKRAKLKLLATALGEYGPPVLRAYGEKDAAADLEARLLKADSTPPGTNLLRYNGRPMTAEEETFALALIDLVRSR